MISVATYRPTVSHSLQEKMPLQQSLQLQHHNASLSPSLSYSRPLPSRRVPSFALLQSVNYQRLPISCCISQIHSYGTLDSEKRPMVKWSAIFKRLSFMENPELGSASLLDQWENEGRKVTKWELCRVVKELRKFKRYELALEVYEWMNNRGERLRLSTSDAAIQLDLISKVHGVSSAEDFFSKLPDGLKDKKIYGALLNAYVKARMKEKAESLLDRMRSKGYVLQSLPYNVMMTLYMNVKEYEKVYSLVSEMIEKNIQLDIYSYNIWLSACGSQESAERMEQVFEQMKLDKTIDPNWTTFSTMATMYIKMGQLDKAEDCLKIVESRITGRDRIPYHYLLSLYGSVGNREEIYRVWNAYKSIFPSIPNLGYHAIISSLVRLGDIEGAEKIYDEWLSVKSTYDPRIVNTFMLFYVKEGNFDKANSFFEHMVEAGGKPNSTSWEALAEIHIAEKRISEALFCWKEAFAAEGSKKWKPKLVNVSNFFDLCEQEADTMSKDVVMELLRQAGYLKDESYASLLGLSVEAISDYEIAADNGSSDNDEENNDSELLLSQL